MLERRALGQELLDGPEFGLQEVVGTFRFLVPVNRWLGGIKPGLSFFQRESRDWDRHTTYHILDAGCGVGDVPLALARWARRQGYHIQVHAMDRHPIIVQLARQKCRGYPEISLSCQDVFRLKGQQQYDYVHASQFVHHFPNEDVPSVLRHLLSLCRHKLVVNDLVRAPVAYLSTWLFTLVTSRVFRHDARLSVRRGFTIDELTTLLTNGGFHGFQLERRFFYRFLLVLNKEV